MQRHEYTGPVALRAMQNLTGRLFPDSGYRHIGDLTWAWCLALDRADDNPTAVWTDGGEAAPAAGSPASGRPLAWAWLELPGSLQLQVDPAHPELADEALAWAAEQATAGRAATGRTATEQAPTTRTTSHALSVEVAETEPHLIAALERHGHPQGRRAVHGRSRAVARGPAGCAAAAGRVSDPRALGFTASTRTHTYV
ncbi:hypothetical protein [Streptomyces tubercidicus]|uniref:hypothetical protein n=1 Tax=Streptomyces tubercidicus TaxID=47759 RepID=UPI00346569B8